MRCADCKNRVSEIGTNIWYCNECDKIIIKKEELLEEKHENA